MRGRGKHTGKGREGGHFNPGASRNQRSNGHFQDCRFSKTERFRPFAVKIKTSLRSSPGVFFDSVHTFPSPSCSSDDGNLSNAVEKGLAPSARYCGMQTRQQGLSRRSRPCDLYYGAGEWRRGGLKASGRGVSPRSSGAAGGAAVSIYRLVCQEVC